MQNFGIAIFKDGKFLTNLTILDTMSYSMITKQLKSAVITMDDPFVPTDKMDISISKVQKVDIKVDLVNNLPFIKIKLPIECSIKSASSSFDHGSSKNIDILEKTISSYLETMILSFLYKISHEYNSDICNFRNILSSKYLTSEEFESVNWQDIFKDSIFDVEIEADLTHNTLFIQN